LRKRNPMSDMRRREFITFLGGTAAAWPLAARAQQAERMRRIGVLMAISEDDPQARARVAVFRQALADLSWTEGRNLKIEGNGDNSRSVSIINQDGVATAIRVLVMVQADQAGSREPASRI
jgi:hypothetical protein